MATPPAPVRPIIVKKITVVSHGGHHGGAWKVAYADFVTAMMAFFLLMWLLGATTEKQRKALADYFAPTLIKTKQETAGSNGLFGGDSIVSADKYPHAAGQTGTKSMTIPRDATGGPKEASGSKGDREKLERMAKTILDKVSQQREIQRLAPNLHFTETSEGMRIDIVDDANFAIFASGTSQLTPAGARIFSTLASVIAQTPNRLIIRGHTDGSPFPPGSGTNNWRLSMERAEVTRSMLEYRGVTSERFARLEGVADREPYIANDKLDPRNRRMSITLGWSK